MKSAREMKVIAVKNNQLICYLEKNIAPKIEQSAIEGKREISIHIDRLPFRGFRPSLCKEITEYLSSFGYTCYTLSNFTRIDVCW